jgi:hypothetical protein
MLISGVLFPRQAMERDNRMIYCMKRELGYAIDATWTEPHRSRSRTRTTERIPTEASIAAASAHHFAFRLDLFASVSCMKEWYNLCGLFIRPPCFDSEAVLEHVR